MTRAVTLSAALACCLAMILPLRSATAGEVLEPFVQGPAFGDALPVGPEPLPPVSAELPMADAEVLPAPSATDDRYIVEYHYEPRANRLPPPYYPSQFSPSPMDAVRRWIPHGIIPLGPRTPDSEKDLGFGAPLPGNGWRSQPFSISTFAGTTDGNALVAGHVHQQPSFYGGVNFGWDYDHYWGIEKRLGFGALNLTDGHHASIHATGFSMTGEYRLMYYPLGDTRWRPFLTTGGGWSDFYFSDDHGAKHLDTVGMIPFGCGLKYFCNERMAVRIDFIDELTFGTGTLSDFHYVALTGGLEVRYGHKLFHMPWQRKDTAGKD